jgi:hypothetical protein
MNQTYVYIGKMLREGARIRTSMNRLKLPEAIR